MVAPIAGDDAAAGTIAGGEPDRVFLDRPGPVTASSAPWDKVRFVRVLFEARRDAYATRWENARTGRSGWAPAVAGGWRKGTTRPYLALTDDVIAAHLMGEVHVGLYPLLDGDTCCWLAADFDGAAAMLDALSYLKAARAVGVPAALEVSRSGIGAHVWFFFTGPVPAAVARTLGSGLLREAMALRGRMDLSSYDRLFPSQDALPAAGSVGNLIAAPLQGRSRKEGATVFLDVGTLEPHEDQWAYLSSLHRLSPREVDRLAGRVGPVRVGAAVDRLTPATATRTRPQPASRVHATLGAGVALDMADLTPAALATLRHAASMPNPAFYDRQRRRFSTWGIPRFLHSYDETLGGALVLPRGLVAVAATVVMEAGSKLEVTDERPSGEPQEFMVAPHLRDDQAAAVADLVDHEMRVLVAPPGAGKTVIACAVIARRATSTLILVDRRTLADQWRARLQEHLGVTAGQLGGGRVKMRGTVDVVTLQTLARRDDLAELTKRYGLVVVDECHHIPAAAFENAVRQIPAKWWLGLTATPYRRDQLDDLITLQLGPVRHTMSAPARHARRCGCRGITGPAAHRPPHRVRLPGRRRSLRPRWDRRHLPRPRRGRAPQPAARRRRPGGPRPRAALSAADPVDQPRRTAGRKVARCRSRSGRAPRWHGRPQARRRPRPAEA